MNIHNIIRRAAVTVCCCLSLYTCAAQATATDTAIYLADPAMFFHDGVYYLYGTVEGEAGKGFRVYTSTNKQSWTSREWALKKGEAYGTKGFWAPQVFARNGKFIMAYVADENIAIAESNSPLGPFTQINKVPLKAPVRQIDPFIFTDTDGRTYLYHVRLTEGNRIFVAEMESDLSAIKPATLKECVSAGAGWENTANAPWPVAEGPTVFKQKGLYYLLYTANDFRNPDYAVGYATSKSPLGPWNKYAGNPIISKSMLSINGTGHGDLVSGPGSTPEYVLHTHHSNEKVGPRRTALIKLTMKNGVISADTASFHFLGKGE